MTTYCGDVAATRRCTLARRHSEDGRDRRNQPETHQGGG